MENTGWFPIQSSQGNEYVVIFYIYDANAISYTPIQNWSQGELLHAYKIV